MPNAFYRAKALWKANQQEQAILLLNNYLEKETGTAPLKPSTGLMTSNPDQNWFELAILVILLQSRKMLLAPFDTVFVALWNLAPSDQLINTLLQKDFYTDRPGEEFFWKIYGQDAEKVDKYLEDGEYPITPEEIDTFLLPGFQNIAQCLELSAREGKLGPDQNEGWYSGRPTLSMERIQEMSEDQSGLLKQILLKHLPDGYSSCPSDYWQKFATSDPQYVVESYLHYLLNFEDKAGMQKNSWEIIKRDHPQYATAIQNSLKVLLKQSDDNLLTDIVRIDGGLIEVKDGRTWLRDVAVIL